MSESERSGVEVERNGGSRYLDRKTVATQLGIHTKTVKQWEKRGAFLKVVSDGPLGKRRYLANEAGQVLLAPAWKESPEFRQACPAGLPQIDKELALAVIREVPAAIAAFPAPPDPVKEALARGEPDEVVAARALGRGQAWKGFWIFAGLLAVAVAISGGAVAYLRRHGLWRS